MKEILKREFYKYFGLLPGGVNLIESVRELPAGRIEKLAKLLNNCNGRIFFMGNGGSYDNARWMAQVCRMNGYKAKVPGAEEDYILTLNKFGYEKIFEQGLTIDKLSGDDLVIGLSGSGNSKNILRAFEYAKKTGAQVYALGGRDGGEMLKVVGGENCLIASSSCMEAIEDLHNFSLIAAIKSVVTKRSVDEESSTLEAQLIDFCSEKNFNGLVKMCEGMILAALNEGRSFILGTGIGANHFRADMGRGATNALPIRGVVAPEVFTMNSLQATANDDGTDFILADGLVKYAPNKNDFAVLCPESGEENCFSVCEEILENRGVNYVSLGEKDIDLSAFDSVKRDLPVAMVGHACGKVINQYLSTIFSVRSINCRVSFKNDQKKLSRSETLKLEKKFRDKEIIAHDEIITFCYGELFAVSSNDHFEREFY